MLAEQVPAWKQGCIGLSEAVFCPFKGQGEPLWKKNAASAHAELRNSEERVFAQLTNWDLRHRSRYCPHRAGQITRTALVLRLREAG